MKASYKKTIKYKILKRLKSLRTNVILRKDFKNLGNERQISRGLKALIQESKLVKIGLGVYTKARITPYHDKPIPYGGFGSVAREALNRLDVNWEPSTFEKQYNLGLSTQVPVRDIVRLKSRFRRKIYYEGNELFFEDTINAK